MWRITAIVLLVVLLLVIGLATFLTKHAPPPPFAASAEGLISSLDASLYYVRGPAVHLLVYLPGSWNASTRSTSNAATRTLITDVTLHANGKPDVLLKWSSASPAEVSVGGETFALDKGSVFRVREDGTVEQLPFAPPSGDFDQAYLKRLHEHVAGAAEP